MTRLLSITDLDLTKKRVVIRCDFNVPIIQDHIHNDRRISAALPTIEYALHQKAAVILLSHLGRPTLPAPANLFSLSAIARTLSTYLKQPVSLVKHWVDGVNIKPGEVLLCENVRLQTGELTDDPVLSQKMAQLGDIIVMDAFSVSHRKAASTVGIIHSAHRACAGLLLLSELENLTVLKYPKKPFTAIIGGAKVSSKITALAGIIQKANHLLLGGGIANTFLAAQSQLIGRSLYEANQVSVAKALIKLAGRHHCKIHIPVDAVLSSTHSNGEVMIEKKAVLDIEEHHKVIDIGPLTVQDYTVTLGEAHTVLWNGPMGIFECAHAQGGTRAIAEAIAHSHNLSIAGGGDTLHAIDKYKLYPTHISTGGGALLDYLAGKPLPMIEALKVKNTT